MLTCLIIKFLKKAQSSKTTKLLAVCNIYYVLPTVCVTIYDFIADFAANCITFR